MNTWKRMIMEGNQSFNTGRLYSAENYYKIACDFACEMSLESSKCSNIIASLVVSYQNLAELYFKKNQIEFALLQYQKLHEKLIELSQHQQCLEQSLMIQNAIRKCGTELLFITKKKGIDTQYSKEVIARIMATTNVNLH